jgi:hypothetical protein
MQGTRLTRVASDAVSGYSRICRIREQLKPTLLGELEVIRVRRPVRIEALEMTLGTCPATCR